MPSKKIDVNAKILILIHETRKNVINFNFELKKLAIMFLLQINEILVLLLKIKTNLNQVF